VILKHQNIETAAPSGGRFCFDKLWVAVKKQPAFWQAKATRCTTFDKRQA
jgi:hypothetical protein